MDLRDLKKEVGQLTPVAVAVAKFQENWLRPLNKDTNMSLPFLRSLEPAVRAQLNKKLLVAQDHLRDLKQSAITEKLQQTSRALVEIKLNILQGDLRKVKMVAKRFVNDEFLNLKQTVTEVKEFEEKVQKLSDHYEDVNDLVHKNLSLEEALNFMELPHYIYLQQLLSTAQDHKRIVRDLGRHFVSLTKDASLKKVPHK